MRTAARSIARSLRALKSVARRILRGASMTVRSYTVPRIACYPLALGGTIPFLPWIQPLSAVAPQGSANQQHVGDRRAEGHEYADQDFVRDWAPFKRAEMQHRADKDESRSERRAHGWRVHPLVE